MTEYQLNLLISVRQPLTSYFPADDFTSGSDSNKHVIVALATCVNGWHR